MTSPAAQPQAGTTPEQAILGALVLVLLSDLPLPTVAANALPLLAALGIEPQHGFAALSLVLPNVDAPRPTVERSGPASAWNDGTQVVRRAEYLVAAARRLAQPGHSVERERQHLARHIAAQRARGSAAKQVDAAARRHGPVLGWYALRDARTTPECRAAHGANFSVATPPVVGWPGTLHGGTCRCRAGAPHDSQLTVDEATSAIRQHEVIPFAVELSHT